MPALMRKRKAEEDAWKPKFMSKKERARLEAAEKQEKDGEPATAKPRNSPATNGTKPHGVVRNGVNGNLQQALEDHRRSLYQPVPELCSRSRAAAAAATSSSQRNQGLQ